MSDSVEMLGFPLAVLHGMFVLVERLGVLMEVVHENGSLVENIGAKRVVVHNNWVLVDTSASGNAKCPPGAGPDGHCME
jgi:hypothetical protein